MKGVMAGVGESFIVFLTSVIEFHLIGRFVANVKVVGMDIISSYVRKIVLMT